MIVDSISYHYASFVIATIFMIPQTIHACYSKSMKDVNGTSLILIGTGSGLWAYYMYEKQDVYFACAAAFASLNACILIIMKFAFYCKRISDHYRSFDQEQEPIALKLTAVEKINNV